MLRIAFAVLTALIIAGLAAPPANASGQDAVILLHGYGRTSWSMWSLENRLEDAGFAVHNLGYPSIRKTPEELVELLDRELAACCRQAPRVHFVTHSLGGILTRAYLAEHRPPNLGRVVMLAPPNQGSELADIVGAWPLLHPILGPTVIQLGTDGNSLPNRLPLPWYDVGIIAGIDDFNPFGSQFVTEPSDGTVSVASTRLDGMSDFVTVRKSHTFIMHSADVAAYVIRFLKTGRFQEPDLPEIPPDQ